MTWRPFALTLKRVTLLFYTVVVAIPAATWLFGVTIIVPQYCVWYLLIIPNAVVARGKAHCDGTCRTLLPFGWRPAVGGDEMSGAIGAADFFLYTITAGVLRQRMAIVRRTAQLTCQAPSVLFWCDDDCGRRYGVLGGDPSVCHRQRWQPCNILKLQLTALALII